MLNKNVLNRTYYVIKMIKFFHIIKSLIFWIFSCGKNNKNDYDIPISNNLPPEERKTNSDKMFDAYLKRHPVKNHKKNHTSTFSNNQKQTNQLYRSKVDYINDLH